MTHAPLPRQRSIPGYHAWGKSPGHLGNRPMLIPKPRPSEQTAGPGLVLSKTSTQKSWLPEPDHEMGPRTITQKETPKRQCILQPCVSEQDFSLPHLHTLPLYLECPSFSSPSGELLCILQDPVQMFLPLKPFRNK